MANRNGKLIAAVVAACAVLGVLGAVAAFAWSWHDDSSGGIRVNAGDIQAAGVRIDRNETDIRNLFEKSNGIAGQVGEVKAAVVEVRTIQTAQEKHLEEMSNRLDTLGGMDSKLDDILKALPRRESP